MAAREPGSAASPTVCSKDVPGTVVIAPSGAGAELPGGCPPVVSRRGPRSATVRPIVCHDDRVRAFACPVCRGFVAFESHRCLNCQAELGFHTPTKTMVATSSGTAVIDGGSWIGCTKAADLGCNWLVPEEQLDHASRGRCLADSLIRREPAADDTIAVEKLASTAVDLRRLTYQLLDIGLPVDPFWRTDGGLAFDLLSSYSAGERIVIGHAGGVITIDLTESLDAYRESLRVRLGEPYRTMLGHFRHEVGHYYQNLLVETGAGVRYLDECRALFGDERADYQAEIARHYQFGAPKSWSESFISEYATMHPWEDFAECFAHYLHRHHQHRGRGRSGSDRRPGARRRSPGHRPARVLR